MDINRSYIRKCFLVFTILFFSLLSTVKNVCAYEFEFTHVDESGDVGEHNAIAFNKADNNSVNIAYYDDTYNKLKLATLGKSGEWVTSIINDTPGINVAYSMDMTTDNSGTIHLAYMKFSSINKKLIYAKKRKYGSQAWEETEIEAWQGNHEGGYVSIEVDKQGNPYISYGGEYNKLQLAYKDKTTPYPYSWTIAPFYRADGISIHIKYGGADLNIYQASATDEPEVRIAYYDNRVHDINLLTYSVLTTEWDEETVKEITHNPGVLYGNPAGVRYVYTGDKHHILYTRRIHEGNLPEPECPPDCTQPKAYYIESTASGWTEPSNPIENINEPSDIFELWNLPTSIKSARISTLSDNRPIIFLNGSSRLHYLIKNGNSWDWSKVGDFLYGQHPVYNFSLDIDTCDNIHVSSYEDWSYSDGYDGKLVYQHGVLDSSNKSCDPDKTSSSSGSSGYSSGKPCRAEFTSWTELPRLVCDFMYLKKAACLTVGCGFHGEYADTIWRGANRNAYKSTENFLKVIQNNNKKKIKAAISSVNKAFRNIPKFDVNIIRKSKSKKQSKDLLLRKNTRDEMINYVAKAMYEISFDSAVPKQVRKKVSAGKVLSIDMNNIAWLAFKDIKKGGEIKLSIQKENGKLNPGKKTSLLWPAAIYDFDFKGELAKGGYVDITINFAGLGYRNPENVRIYEVKKNIVRDITSQIDPERKIVTGRTNNIDSYILVENIE